MRRSSKATTFIAKNLIPISKAQIGGDEQRYFLIASGAELEEERGGQGRERNGIQLIRDNKLLLESSSNKTLESLYGLCRDELVEERCDIVEAHFVALPTGRQCQRNGDVRFSHAGRTQEDDGFDSGNIVALSQAQHLRPCRRLDRVEVKIAEFLQEREPGEATTR